MLNPNMPSEIASSIVSLDGRVGEKHMGNNHVHPYRPWFMYRNICFSSRTAICYIASEGRSSPLSSSMEGYAHRLYERVATTKAEI
jgi:hypothetical protein